MAGLSVMTVLVHLSCTTPTDGEAWQGTIVERDGTVYVTNPERGLWDDEQAEPVRFVLEQTFGTDAGADETVLGIRCASTSTSMRRETSTFWTASGIASSPSRPMEACAGLRSVM